MYRVVRGRREAHGRALVSFRRRIELVSNSGC